MTQAGEARIIIVGPGAMGCGVAAYLSSKGADVALLDHRPERAAQMNAGGIRWEFGGQVRTAHVPVSADPEQLGQAELVVLLVKAYSTREAAEHAAPCVAPHGALLTLQNGLGNYEVIAEVIPRYQVLAGPVVMGCASTGTGQVRISGIGQITVGSPFGNDELAGKAAGILDPYWPSVAAVDDVEPAIWRKVIVNVAVNPLTAITGLNNGALLDDPELLRTLNGLVLEATAVARAAGVEPFGDEDPRQVVQEVCRVTGNNRSSMLQDVAAGRRTEIENICGQVARRGEALGVPTPLCQAMTALVKQMASQ